VHRRIVEADLAAQIGLGQGWTFIGSNRLLAYEYDAPVEALRSECLCRFRTGEAGTGDDERLALSHFTVSSSMGDVLR
jgi:hypothetical protein